MSYSVNPLLQSVELLRDKLYIVSCWSRGFTVPQGATH